jgi:hypothetical protein
MIVIVALIIIRIATTLVTCISSVVRYQHGRDEAPRKCARASVMLSSRDDQCRR